MGTSNVKRSLKQILATAATSDKTVDSKKITATARKLKMSYRMARKGVNQRVLMDKDPTKQIKVLLKKNYVPIITEEVKSKVSAFYKREDVSRQMPGRKNTIKIDGQRIATHILEMTLTVAYGKFKKEFPQIKIGQRTFEKLRSKDVKFSKLNQRIVCGCIYHINMDYAILPLDSILKVNINETYKFSGKLSDDTICEYDDIPKLDCIRAGSRTKRKGGA